MKKDLKSSGSHRLSDLVDFHTFWPATIVLLAAVIWGIAAPHSFGAAANAALGFVTDKFSWLYALVTSFFLFFCLWVMFGKMGKIRFGGPNAKPEFSYFTWFCITLTSCIAVGILFYCVAEPMGNSTNPPGFTDMAPRSADAAEAALQYTYLHWAFHPYSMYAAIGVCIGFMYWNCGQKYRISSALYPLMGERCDGRVGSWINSLCLFAMVAGVGTSFGLGVLQLASGIEYVFHITLPTIPLWAAIIFGYALVYILAACSGLKKAISRISDANVYIYIILLVGVLLLGGTTFILNNTISSSGSYLDFMLRQVFYLEPVKQSGWIGDNTIFYWGWWFVYAPVSALFLIKLAKGRTLREFVIVNMVLPSLFALVWFGFFGSAAIRVEHFGPGGIAAAIEEYGIAVALFAFLRTQKFSTIMIVLAFLAMLFSFVTMAQSMSLTMADMVSARVLRSQDDRQTAPNSLKAFWGLMLAFVAFALLISGGLSALQTASIVCGLPIIILLLFMMYAFIKAARNPAKYDLTMQGRGSTDPPDLPEDLRRRPDSVGEKQTKPSAAHKLSQ